MTANIQSQAIVRVVDDDPDVRRSWQFVIEGEGWNVLTYASALEFLEKDSPFTPGCLVLDVRMPEMSGIELQHAMKIAAHHLHIGARRHRHGGEDHEGRRGRLSLEARDAREASRCDRAGGEARREGAS